MKQFLRMLSGMLDRNIYQYSIEELVECAKYLRELATHLEWVADRKNDLRTRVPTMEVH